MQNLWLGSKLPEQRTAKAVIERRTGSLGVLLPEQGTRTAMELTAQPVSEVILAAIDDQPGAAVYLATWSLSRHELQAVLDACASARPVLFLADRSIESRSGLRILDHIAETFDRLVVTKTHAKLYVVGSVVISTSANLARPRGLETRIIWRDDGVAAEAIEAMEAAASKGKRHG